MLEDPLGRCVSFVSVAGGPVGAILGAGTNVAAYIATQRITNNKITLGGMYVKYILYFSLFYQLCSSVVINYFFGL